MFVDRRPEFSSRGPTHGDYVARGEGSCEVRGVSTRWAYFVAAPGLRPVHEIGIPASGLYVVVAVAPEGERAESFLDRLIRHLVRRLVGRRSRRRHRRQGPAR